MVNNTYTQTSYPSGQRKGAPGDLTGAGPHKKITAAAMETLKAGRFAFLDFSQGDRPGIRYARPNVMYIVFGADASTGTFSGTLKKTQFDGTVTTHAISRAYGTSHSATADNLLGDFNGISGITATFTDGSTKRSIKLVAAAGVSLSEHVAFGWSSVPSTTVSYGSTDVINAIVGIDQTLEKDADGNVEYAVKDDVLAYRMGEVFMDAATAMAADDPLFARLTVGSGDNEQLGSLRDSAGTPAFAIAVPGRVTGVTTAADETASVEVNFIGL